MDSAALDLSGELAEDLAANDEQAVADAPERFSTLKMIGVSPLHYQHARRSQYEETLSMRLGSGAHAILFEQPYVVWAGKDRKAKGYKEFADEHAGETILTRSEESKARAMANAIRNHASANRLLFSGAKLEQRIDWEWQGRKFRSTPDAAGASHLVDLKCLRSADPDKIKWQSRNMNYHAQAALYRRALAASDGRTIKDCYLCVVENKAPYPVTVLRFTETALEAGDRACASWMDLLADCEQRNHWPGYRAVGDIVDLDIPETIDDFTFGDEEEEI